MAVSVSITRGRRLELSFRETAGALGDSITVLPILVALAALTPVSLAHALLLFGAFQVVWGVWYGLPMSVEPMKALAALAIAGTISYAEFLLAGVLAGCVLLAFGRTNTLARFERFVGEPVVRGIQLAVALVLVRTGLDLAVASPTLAALGIVVALGTIALGYGNAGAPVVLGLGVALAVWSAGLPTPRLPGYPSIPIDAFALTPGVFEGAIAQLAMTVGNAAVATSLLASDLFDADVSADELSTSMGTMTLAAIPLGGVPMCHGSGGLAGKYAFGARTAGANVVLGVLYLLAALVAGAGFFVAFPMAMLGVLLVLVAVELGKAALRSEAVGFVACVGLVGLLTNVGVAFLVGVVGYRVLSRTGFGVDQSP